MNIVKHVMVSFFVWFNKQGVFFDYYYYSSSMYLNSQIVLSLAGATDVSDEVLGAREQICSSLFWRTKVLISFSCQELHAHYRRFTLFLALLFYLDGILHHYVLSWHLLMSPLVVRWQNVPVGVGGEPPHKAFLRGPPDRWSLYSPLCSITPVFMS